SRFREELRHGHEPHAAVVRTIETAGRTVAFSAVTVAVALAVLLMFPLSFLRSFAYAGIAVVALAAVGAIVVLGALLAVLGPRVDAWALWHRQAKEPGEGFWHRIAMFVMRRPLPIAAGVIIVLLLLGGPFLRIRFGSPDDRVLPPSASSRQVSDVIRHQFTSAETTALSVVAPRVGDLSVRLGDVDRYALPLSSAAAV